MVLARKYFYLSTYLHHTRLDTHLLLLCVRSRKEDKKCSLAAVCSLNTGDDCSKYISKYLATLISSNGSYLDTSAILLVNKYKVSTLFSYSIDEADHNYSIASCDVLIRLLDTFLLLYSAQFPVKVTLLDGGK